MSRHFFYRLFPFVKALAREAKPNIFTLLGTTIFTTYCHGSFALATNKTEEICVAKKYKYVSNGFTNFMIVDTNGRHFNVNNSFWYWKWDAIEDWTNIKKGENKIFVSYYGYRIPFLGMFPNVVEVSSNLTPRLEERKERRKKRVDVLLSHIHI
jgi:hypothetical protein